MYFCKFFVSFDVMLAVRGYAHNARDGQNPRPGVALMLEKGIVPSRCNATGSRLSMISRGGYGIEFDFIERGLLPKSTIEGFLTAPVL